MGCDIHIITEVKRDGKWEFIPDIPESLNTRNYTTFAVLSGVRDSFNSNIFPVRGLPSDMQKKKFRFRSNRQYMEKRYNEEKATCLVIGDEVVGEPYSCDDERYKKTCVEITELEYEYLNNMKHDSWSYNSRYQSLGWSESGGVKTYYVYDASVVGGEWKSIPYNKIFDSFDDFAKKHYEDEWDEDAQDYGYWRVNFDSEDYHTPNYITLKEFEDADYSDYTMMKCKISKEFYRAFISNGGILPSAFKVEESSIGDIRDAFSEAISPTVTIGWQNDDIDKEKYPIFAGIDELKKIAEKYNITNHEDIRIIFAFDN